MAAVAVVVYLDIARRLLPHYYYQVNPDGISYITIAQRYLGGDWSGALNGHWSPMLSWLLAPVLAVDDQPLRAAKLVTIASGCVFLIAMALLGRAMRLRTTVLGAVMICAIALALNMALSLITADLLLAGILLAYLSVVMNRHYPQKWWLGLVCGLTAALAYFAKNFAMPFFLCHFLLVLLMHLVESRRWRPRRRAIIGYVAGLAVFMVVCGPWVALLSTKYDRFTISTQGRFNNALNHPGGLHRARPGFRTLPDDVVVSATGDAPVDELRAWSPFASAENFQHQISIFVANAKKIGQHLVMFSSLAPLVGVVCVILCFRWPRRLIRRRWLMVPVMAVVIYCCGYALVQVVARYLWPLWGLLILMAGGLLSRTFAARSMRHWAVRTIALVVMVSMFVPPAINELVVAHGRADAGFRLHGLSEALRKIEPIEGVIASDQAWSDTMVLAFHLRCQYIGVPTGIIGDDQIGAEVQLARPDFFFFWDRSRPPPSYLDGAREITGGRFEYLKIFDLRNRWRDP